MPPKKIAILGLSGRSQYFLVECLQCNKNIRVAAVCDDYAQQSLNFFINKLEKEKNPYINDFIKAFANTQFYADNDQGLRQLFQEHPNLDLVFITSANYNHFKHLNAALAYSSCKNLYIEKPLMRSLDEFLRINIPDDVNVLVGLTLRYSSMAKIVVDELQRHKAALGTLQKVNVWEHVRFCQALTNFMMCWRRFISLSGGLLLEKCIHDLDLALFFIQSLGTDFQTIGITTKTAHTFFVKSQKQKILDYALTDPVVKKTLIDRELSPFQRIIDYTLHHDGTIDWAATIKQIFEGLPDSERANTGDIIPDYHQLSATIQEANGHTIDFTLEVKLGGFQPTTTRGMRFVFEHGVVAIDVMESSMITTLDSGEKYFCDLRTNNSDHANGDRYIAHALLGTLKEGSYTATINDPMVTLATMMGLVSEQQASCKSDQIMKIAKKEDTWVVVH